MSALIINYSELAHTEKHARSVVDKIDNYISGLTKTGTKCGSVTGGSSSALTSAQYYIDAKVAVLNKKKERYNDYANQIHAFSENAKRIDKEVKTAIVNEQKSFLSAHENLKINSVKAAFINFLTSMKNFCPVFDFIGTMFQKVFDKIKSIQEAIQEWYYLQGGREKLAFWGAIAGAIALILLAIAAWPAEIGIIAIAGFIGAVIAAINGIVNVITSYKAWKSAESGDPLWAKRYGKMDKLSDVFRSRNHHNKYLNLISDCGADLIDTVEFVCDAIDIVGTIKNFDFKANIECIQRAFNKEHGLLKYMSVTKWKRVKTANGLELIRDIDKETHIAKTEITLNSFLHGARQVLRNEKVYDDASSFTCEARRLAGWYDSNGQIGLRTLLCKNFKENLVYDWKSLKYTVSGGYKLKICEFTNDVKSFKHINDTISSVKKFTSSGDLIKNSKTLGKGINTVKNTYETIEKISVGKYKFKETIISNFQEAIGFDGVKKPADKVVKLKGKAEKIIKNSVAYDLCFD